VKTANVLYGHVKPIFSGGFILPAMLFLPLITVSHFSY